MARLWIKNIWLGTTLRKTFTDLNFLPILQRHVCCVGIQMRKKQYVTLIITLPLLQLKWTIQKVVILFRKWNEGVSSWSAVSLKRPIRTLGLSTGNSWACMLQMEPLNFSACQPQQPLCDWDSSSSFAYIHSWIGKQATCTERAHVIQQPQHKLIIKKHRATPGARV